MGVKLSKDGFYHLSIADYVLLHIQGGYDSSLKAPSNVQGAK
jgi:hypothetical protein